MPPIVEGISLEPADPKYVLDPEERSAFSLEMFQPGGFLHEEPLNHYINFRLFNSDRKFSINAGYLMHHFVLDERLGYKEISRLCKMFKTPLPMLEKVGEECRADDTHTCGDDEEGS